MPSWTSAAAHYEIHPSGWMGRVGMGDSTVEGLPWFSWGCSSRRYILIDWLVEVATMKDFTSLCLHLTVECVDRYLRRRPVPRYRLQLLGIACMVICTR